MGYVNSITEGFRFSLNSRGRMNRSDFFRFAPIALIPPVLFATEVDWLDVHRWHGMAKLAALFVFSVPLLNAIARRLNDAGFSKAEAFYPFAPLAILWVGYQCILWVGLLLAELAGFLVLTFWLLALFVLIPLHIIAFFLTLMITATVIGQTLVPSTSHPALNRINSNEVPQ